MRRIQINIKAVQLGQITKLAQSNPRKQDSTNIGMIVPQNNINKEIKTKKNYMRKSKSSNLSRYDKKIKNKKSSRTFS